MRVPLSWLREFVEFDFTPEQLAERLTLLGMEVKKIEQWGADWRNVVVGELLSVEKHPRADRLSLTRVTIGEGEPLEVVCGATNIAVGQRVPVALPGALLAALAERAVVVNTPLNWFSFLLAAVCGGLVYGAALLLSGFVTAEERELLRRIAGR